MLRILYYLYARNNAKSAIHNNQNEEEESVDLTKVYDSYTSIINYSYYSVHRECTPHPIEKSATLKLHPLGPFSLVAVPV